MENNFSDEDLPQVDLGELCFSAGFPQTQTNSQDFVDLVFLSVKVLLLKIEEFTFVLKRSKKIYLERTWD